MSSSREGFVELAVTGRTDVGRVRRNNEDSFLIADLSTGERVNAPGPATRLAVGERGVLLAVSDGMGGAAAGELASSLALESLREAAAGITGEPGPEAALQAAVGHANLAVFTAGREAGREGMGATLTACLVYGSHAYLAEVGDSRAYVLRGGRLVQLTRDQSYVQLLLDSGDVTPEVARQSIFKNVILQAVGKGPDVAAALTRLALRRGDRLLLCSDGLSGKVPDREIQAIVAKPSLEAAAQRLIDEANARGGEDNITVVLASVDGEGVPEGRTGEDVAHTLETIRRFEPR